MVNVLKSIATSSRRAEPAYPLQDDAPQGLRPIWLRLEYNLIGRSSQDLDAMLEEAEREMRQIRCRRGFEPCAEVCMICFAPKPGCNSSSCCRLVAGSSARSAVVCPLVHMPWIRKQSRHCDEDSRQSWTEQSSGLRPAITDTAT